MSIWIVGSSYLDYYQETVDRRHLNFFIGDGDILQFSFFEQGRTFSLRYAFFGSPYRSFEKSTDPVSVTSEEVASMLDDGMFKSLPSEQSVEDISKVESSEEEDQWLGAGVALDGEPSQPEVDGAGLSLRYEYAEDEYRRLVHPCAHLHVGWRREGRIPVRRIWTPELFTAFVLRNIFAG